MSVSIENFLVTEAPAIPVALTSQVDIRSETKDSKSIEDLIDEMMTIAEVDPFRAVYFGFNVLIPALATEQEAKMVETANDMYDMAAFNDDITYAQNLYDSFRDTKDDAKGEELQKFLKEHMFNEVFELQNKGIIDEGIAASLTEAIGKWHAQLRNPDYIYTSWNRKYLQKDSEDPFEDREWGDYVNSGGVAVEVEDIGRVFTNMNILKATVNNVSGVAQVDAKETVSDYNMFLSALKNTAKEFNNQEKIPVRQI